MGYLIKFKHTEAWFCRGKKVRDRDNATYYVSASAARAQIERWAVTHPEIRLQIRHWVSDEPYDYKVQKEKERKVREVFRKELLKGKR